MKTQLLRGTVPAAAGAAIFAVIAVATGGDATTVVVGAVIVGGITFAVSVAISLAISRSKSGRDPR